MVKITYIGGFSEARIRVGNAFYDKWKKGESREIGEEGAKELLKNKDFTTDKSKFVEEKKEEPVEEKANIDFDLNKDGKVDSEDRSIAAKVMRSGRNK